jgi:hypothetical protein
MTDSTSRPSPNGSTTDAVGRCHIAELAVCLDVTTVASPVCLLVCPAKQHSAPPCLSIGLPSQTAPPLLCSIPLHPAPPAWSVYWSAQPNSTQLPLVCLLVCPAKQHLLFCAQFHFIRRLLPGRLRQHPGVSKRQLDDRLHTTHTDRRLQLLECFCTRDSRQLLYLTCPLIKADCLGPLRVPCRRGQPPHLHTRQIDRCRCRRPAPPPGLRAMRCTCAFNTLDR